MCGFSNRLVVGTGGSAIRTKAQLSNVTMEYQLMQPLILHGGILSFSLAFHSTEGTMQKEVLSFFFFSIFVDTVNPHGAESAKKSAAN